MDIVKFKITPKTIIIEVRNINNYLFDFNEPVEINKEDRDVLLKLHNALNILFKEESNPECKNYIAPNQINIFDQIDDFKLNV
ncbi:hypothetical protein [Gelidibacter mesophilus]|uniref:hypothetical protein n=1 Tax=Gelidibacter mesophilus TaxID=169050 RepID=UPI0004181692|nr:hypothetical protein [Gelidibacter mesophilus]